MRHEAPAPSPLRGEGRGEGADGPRQGANKAAATRLTRLARGMRHAPTTPEARLWRALRDRQVAGMKFRRQAPLGTYIVDFYCADAALVVEADGESHAARGVDDARNGWLAAHGLTVLRFWNGEIMANLDGVLQTIAAAAPRSGG